MRYIFLKILVFVFFFVFNKYFILVFDMLRSVTDIQIFLVRSKMDNESNQKFTNIFYKLSVNNKNKICIIGLSIRYPF